MIADARINASAPARLILDTGADRTLISPRALAAAGVSLSRTVATGKIVGVTGTDRLPYVMIESLEVGGARVGPMPVGAYDMADADADGLLGRDVLDRFNIAIDSARGLVTLSPK
jgi:predicted aspartyl protease